MRTVAIRAVDRPGVKETTAGYCETFLCRLRGLMFTKPLPPGRGLLLVLDSESRMDASIHMFWMRFDLVIVWINAALQVVDIKPAYKWRSMLIPKQPAKYILELPIQNIGDYEIGDTLEISNSSAH